MSSPESKCVSRETAERLKAAGFPQDTERVWHPVNDGWFLNTLNHGKPEGGEIAAPDAQEILEQFDRLRTLPHLRETVKDMTYDLTVQKGEGEYGVCYLGRDNKILDGTHFVYPSCAEALVSLWLCLKEQGLI